MKLLLSFFVSFFLYTTYLSANGHIFVYHRFGDDRHPSTNTTIKELTRQFDYFNKNGYKVVPLSKIVAKVKNNEKVPSKWVSLNIDDSFKSFYKNGLDVFRKYNFPFTLFVYTEAVNKRYPDFMTWKQIKDTSKYGEIGLHSYAHDHMTYETIAHNKKDTKRAFDDIVKNVGLNPKYYCYPYGEYNEEVKKTIKSFGFDAIFNQNNGSVTKNSDVYDIERTALVGNVNLKHKFWYKTPKDIKWLDIKVENNVITHIRAEVKKSAKKVKFYASRHKWMDIPVKNGIVDFSPNLKIKKERTKIMLGYGVFNVSIKVVMKTRKAKK